MSYFRRLSRPTTLRALVPISAVLVFCLPLVAEREGGAVADVSPAAEETAAESSAVSLSEVVVLGMVEGITEYLPVSSTGHLILVQRAMNIANSDAANSFVICIQAGAIAAVLLLYFSRVSQVFRSFSSGDKNGQRIALCLVVAFLPAAVVGLCLDDFIESYLFGVKPIVAAWFLGGVLILVVARWQKGRPSKSGCSVESMTWKMALVIGIAQTVAMWPGTSRSLMTIVGGVLVGLSLPAAVEFSFLLGMITLGAATVYKGIEHGPVLVEAYGWVNLAVGFLTAAGSAALAVKWMVNYLNKHGLEVFGYYRVGLSIVVGALIIIGVI